MNILFVCHRLPFPPKRGGKIRPFNIIRHLTESGHSVTVASLARSAAELADGAGLRDYCEDLIVERIGPFRAWLQMILRLPTLIPSSMGYFYSPKLDRRIRAAMAARRFDLIFVHCSSVAQYVDGRGTTPAVMDFGDMDSQKWLDYSQFRAFPLSLGFRLEGAKLLRAEKRLAQAFDLATCTTRAELDTLRSYEAARRTDWFPNGVDADFFAPKDGDYDGELVCFVGRMDYFPNQQGVLFFCREVLPLLKSRRQGIRFVVVGAEPSREILALARDPAVTVTGTVADVRDWVRRSALTVAPLFIARGTQNKILESMAMGVPVVCSEIASRGVDAVPGEHLLTAGSPTEYADRILDLLNDPARRSALAVAGRQRVLDRHAWSRSMRRVDDIIATAAPGGQ